MVLHHRRFIRLWCCIISKKGVVMPIWKEIVVAWAAMVYLPIGILIVIEDRNNENPSSS